MVQFSVMLFAMMLFAAATPALPLSITPPNSPDTPTPTTSLSPENLNLPVTFDPNRTRTLSAAKSKCTIIADYDVWAMQLFNDYGCNMHRGWERIDAYDPHVCIPATDPKNVPVVRSFAFSGNSPLTVRLYHNKDCKGKAYKEKSSSWGTLHWEVDNATTYEYNNMLGFKVSVT
ncbi:hypothetical protein BJ138DRAFT_1100262 [Hygrophoropsis aurantiaca]|uniref:Uncharacterized protein n=1 Tax=Hygrophoropsis aurantiaca TaxID=72124 RepID=A0ACB8AHI0_9AGAM|nr:hypothetical protein BJ138DRAFT_1100262 [Hygrophoropsis aurantiaca]